MTEQLRASGMLEAVRVRSLAFAHREDAEAFAARVAPLLPQQHASYLGGGGVRGAVRAAAAVARAAGPTKSSSANFSTSPNARSSCG